jgi:BASS family bile acid:Na+ symporter
MTAQELLMLMLKVSLALSIFAIGLKATFRDATCMVRRPAKFLRSVISVYLLVPAFAIVLAMSFNLNPAVKIALVFLSLSPIPPVLPAKALKAGGDESYAVGLLVAVSILSIGVIPLAMSLAGTVANLVFASLLAPLAVGMLLRAIVPAFAERVAKPVALAGTIMLILGFLPVLFAMREAIYSLVGDGTLVALAAFAFGGLLIGHALGGPEREDRTVLALYSSSRHPAIAIAMAQANFPQQRLAIVAVIMALLIGALVSAPYLGWTKGRQPAVVQASNPQTDI